MKKIQLITPFLSAALLVSCSHAVGKKDASTTSKSSKHQKTHTFVAPPPPTHNNSSANSQTSSTAQEEPKAPGYDKSLNIDTAAHFEISKYAYYEVTDSNQRQVRPELIEKYRRARNNNTYINLYPTDWAGIMKDRGLKPVKEKRQRVRRQRTHRYSQSNNYYGANYYRPRGWSLFPILSYGWNPNSGWAPNMGVAVGPRAGWGPYGAATWNGRRRGMQYAAGMPVYYNNAYNRGAYGYPQGHYGNTYYNNIYNYNVPAVAPTVQSSGAGSPQSPSTTTQSEVSNNAKPEDTKTKSSTNSGDWSDGVGGPERYTSKTKKIKDYEVK